MSKSQHHKPSSQYSDILVAGGGPAGCTAAIGLARLGYTVTLVTSPRTWRGCEGISSRTLQGLRNAGMERAAATVSPPSHRQVTWNGQSSAANTEHLAQRQVFDEALLEDAAAAGVQLLPGRMRRVVDQSDEGLSILVECTHGSTEILPCRFLVDARGRQTPGQKESGQQGPISLSLLQRRTGTPTEPGSSVHSFADGWAWLANANDGQTFVQLTVDADTVNLPGRGQLNQWFNSQVEAVPGLAELCGDSIAEGEITARGSTSILRGELVTGSSMRVGDAAMAVDPLSGNGIFQSLSSSLIAPSVINTLLSEPENAGLASTFYEDRLKHSFDRFTRTGRDFYRMETRWPESSFWKVRQEWPDDQPAHTELPPELVAVESRPVIRNGLIVSRDVVITNDQPLGVWHVLGVELAPLLRGLPEDKSGRRTVLHSRITVACAENTTALSAVMAWMQRYGEF